MRSCVHTFDNCLRKKKAPSELHSCACGCMNEMSLSTLGMVISFVESAAMFLVAIGVGSKLTCGSVEAKWMLSDTDWIILRL